MFFYFDFRNENISPATVLRSLIKQLSLQCTNTPDALVKLFSDSAEGQQSSPPEELMSTAKSIIQCFSNVYIIFDALDECPERAKLLSFLGLMHNWNIDKLHLLVTSRRERDIELRLKPLMSHEVPMDERLVDKDIQIHVSKVLDQDIEFQMCSAEEKQRIETTLIGRAHGM